ncbi:MAG: hypothetical protein K8R54_08370 [Bacteroidales bacterium]|nr:hypothetical protein [Bacteroidales bacterium]
MENQKTFDLLDIFIYLWKKKIPIIIVTVAGAIISIIVSLMMTDYFKAETVLFPTTFISPATSMLRINTNQETDPMIIGDEDDLERMIQLLKSDFITEKIIQKYDLINHYDISPNDPYLKTKVTKAYKGNVTFSKTPYQGVIISVVDTDPVTASKISNDISVLFDSLVNDMQRQRLIEAYDITLKAYNSELEFVNKLEDSLDIYRQLGVLDYFKEVERYSEAFGKAVGNNTLSNKGQRFFDNKFALLQKYGKKAYSLTSQINILRKNSAQLRLNLVQTEQNLKQPMTHKYVISYAQPPDKKAFPKRMFIVIFSTFGAFMFAVALILFLDFIKEFINRIKKEKQ